MNATVTLDEVLAAASARAASLVPETSGYLALAIADATTRLPFRVRDRSVQLTTEGTVTVARGKEVVRDAEAAAVLRDILARLLSVSTGSMRGLSAAARARGASERSLEDVMREIEAALIPVNRTAARRALGRLARETRRAKDAGALGAAPRSASIDDARRQDRAPRVEAAPLRLRPADVPVESARPAPVAATSRYDEEWDADDGAPPDDAGAPTPTEIGMSLVEEIAPALGPAGDHASADPADAEAAHGDPAARAEAAESEPAATVAESDDAPAVDPLDRPEALVEAVRRMPKPQQGRGRQSFRTPPPLATDPVLARTDKPSRMDDLLDRFASAPDEDVAMRSAARSLRAFAGLDATPPPLGVVTLAIPSPGPPTASEPEAPEESGPRIATGRSGKDDPIGPSAQPRAARPRLALPLLIVVLGLAGTAAWHFQDSLRAALSLSRL